jgi:hypothetical protein
VLSTAVTGTRCPINSLSRAQLPEESKKKSQKSFFTDALEENRGRKPTTFTPPSFHDFQNAADIERGKCARHAEMIPAPAAGVEALKPSAVIAGTRCLLWGAANTAKKQT